MGIDKTHDSIKTKYVQKPISMCNTLCYLSDKKPKKSQTSSAGNRCFSLPICKIRLDVSGTYPKTLSGNKYITGFVDWYSGWPEAFAVPDKTAEIIAHLLLEEIIPRHSTPLSIVTDNGSENIKMVMKHTLQEINIIHVSAPTLSLKVFLR